MPYWKQIKRLIAWSGVFIWMFLIFYLSHQPATVSSELSSEMTDKILLIIDMLAPFLDSTGIDLHSFIRKAAHFIAYFVLGCLVLNAFMQYDWSRWKSIGLTFGMSVAFAISDEFHQVFIPGRSGEVRDVLIDSLGAIVGISFLLFVIKRRSKQ